LKKEIEVWFWDLKHPLNSRETFEKMKPYDDTVLLTFNFIGLSGESQFADGECSIWDTCGIPCICIMVDHPMYYYRQLHTDNHNWTLCCVDRDHCRFVERFYPGYGKVHFLPLAGTKLDGAKKLTAKAAEPGRDATAQSAAIPDRDAPAQRAAIPGRNAPAQSAVKHWEKIPVENRPIDLLFAGNYVALSDLLPKIDGMDAESRDYYFSIAKELIAHPNRAIDEVILEYLGRDFPEADSREFLPVMYSMVFIDLYVRSYFRREIVCSLAEAGLPLAVIGKDWEKSGCRNPENLHQTGQLDSRCCLSYMQQSKLSLNIMPWFKDGAHDRIFNAMLQGSAVVTDSSRYLDEILTDGENAILYSLEERELLPDLIRDALRSPARLADIASQGYRTAQGAHTWAHRAEYILKL
jgi:hypothetical protein